MYPFKLQVYRQRFLPFLPGLLSASSGFPSCLRGHEFSAEKKPLECKIPFFFVLSHIAYLQRRRCRRRRTWCAWCSSSILSWRIWQSYSRLFLSICLLSFSTAVRSSSLWSSLRGSPYFMTWASNTWHYHCSYVLGHTSFISWVSCNFWSNGFQRLLRFVMCSEVKTNLVLLQSVI